MNATIYLTFGFRIRYFQSIDKFEILCVYTFWAEIGDRFLEIHIFWVTWNKWRVIFITGDHSDMAVFCVLFIMDHTFNDLWQQFNRCLKYKSHILTHTFIHSYNSSIGEPISSLNLKIHLWLFIFDSSMSEHTSFILMCP